MTQNPLVPGHARPKVRKGIKAVTQKPCARGLCGDAAGGAAFFSVNLGRALGAPARPSHPTATGAQHVGMVWRVVRHVFGLEWGGCEGVLCVACRATRWRGCIWG